MSKSKKPLILELDFGMGNIRSLQKAFEYLGQPVEVVSEPAGIKQADALLLPGDGAFGKAMEEISSRGFYEEILDHHAKQKPVLGICIGFQILFSGSHEFGAHTGMDLFSGEFHKLETGKLPLPHIGWNQTKLLRDSPLTQGIPDLSYFYYVHSYAVDRKEGWVVGKCYYGQEFVSIIAKDNLFGVQFHPEKSQKAGLKLLKKLLESYTGKLIKVSVFKVCSA